MRLKKFIWFFLVISSVFIFSSDTHTRTEPTRPVYQIPVHSEVDFGMLAFIKRGIREAIKADAGLIVLGIDTPGGRVDAALDIVREISELSIIPVYGFVEDKAWSAGALIALACEKIIMREGSSIGSAMPVSGRSSPTDEKFVSALRAKFRSIAKKNGYSENLSTAMVDKDLEIVRVILDGEEKILSGEQISILESDRGALVIKEYISTEGKLLNLSYHDALTFGISSKTVSGIGDILSIYGFNSEDLVTVRKNFPESLSSFFSGTIVSSLLISLGFIFLFLEFEEPGIGWPLIFSMLCFSLFFFAGHIADIAKWFHVLIFIAGVLLVFTEIFISPGAIVPGIAGGVFILASLFLVLGPKEMPRYPWDFLAVQRSLAITMGSLIAGISGSLFLASNLHRIPGASKLVLIAALSEKDSLVGADPLVKIGAKGIALTDLRPVGRVRFGKNVFDGVSREGYLGKGEKVKVVDNTGNRILIERR